MFENQLKCRCASIAQHPSSFFIPEAKPHYAPDRLIDVEHIKLELAVDLPSKALKGSCATEFRVVAPSINKINFDAIDLIVSRVLDAEGQALRFDQQPQKLSIFWDQPLTAGQNSRVTIEYSVTEPRAGLYFIQPDKDYPDRPWQLWTQGQDQDNRYWIPCHDSPNEKAATEMIVTVDAKLTAISNGKLLSASQNGNKKTFHWKQAIPHSSYLITLCVGEFVELKDSWRSSRDVEVPVLYYTLAGREAETKLSFGKTPRMIDFFSKKIGIDYPYEKYAQVVAWDFIYGGMENTSSSTQTEYTLHPEEIELDYSSEPLVAHELAHQWFGDLLTCKEWAHAWLNEGFATYFEALWIEEEHGKDEFLYELFVHEKGYKAEDGGRYRRPIVTNKYLAPSDIFDRHLYEKGGRVLHMLRRIVGDELWWKSIHRYVTAHYAKTVETVDLQRAFEETTGRALAWFFEQWLYKAGHPEIKASYEWIAEKKQVKLTVAQKQKEDDLTIKMRLPLQCKIAFGETREPAIHEMEVTESEHTFWFSAPEKPAFVSLNPENTILGNWDFDPGRESLINQLSQDKDIMGRIFAARALAKDHSRQSIDALGTALGRETFWGVQLEIAEALGQIGSPLCEEYLSKSWAQIKHPKARKSAMRALGSFRSQASAEAAQKALSRDSSPLVQYEAGLALGRARINGVFEILEALLGNRESWHDSYDRGILQGLAELKHDDRVLPILARHTAPGPSVFLRREAIDALAKYGAPRPVLVVDALSDLTRDQNFFVKLYAIEALHHLGDDRAMGALKRVADSTVEPRTHRAALMAMKGVREGKTTNESVEKLKNDFDRLREQYQALLGRMEKIER